MVFRMCILKLGYRIKQHYLSPGNLRKTFFLQILFRKSLYFNQQEFYSRIDIVLMQSYKNKEQNQFNLKSISYKPNKEQVKLPYLRLNQPIKPLQYKKSQSQNNRLLQYTFDLHTNHAAIPRYEASKDTNLVYFFSKPANKKIIDELKNLQTVTKRKQPQTQRSHNQSVSLHLTKGVRAVSKNDFDSQEYRVLHSKYDDQQIQVTCGSISSVWLCSWILLSANHHADEVLRSYQKHPLYIGDISAAEDIKWLKNNKIGVVMTVASGFNLVYDHSIVHIRYDLQDSKNENIGQYFDECSKQIQRYLRSTGVLVHCDAGVSRSSTVIIAYLIKYKGMNFAQALKFLKSKRPQVCPNLGFQLQLKSYEGKNNLSKNLLQRKHIQKPQQLPGITKVPVFHTTTYNKSFGPIGIQNLKSQQNVNKKDRTEIKEKQQFEYLRKMTEFRFGITNMSRWRISSKHENSTKKGYDF